MENIEKIVEAIVFSSGSAIEKKALCEKIPELTTQKLNTVVKNLQKKYDGDSGVLLLEFNGKLQFSSNPKYGTEVADVLTPLKEKELTKTLLEVLASIAYKQPITRMEIDDMRGGTNSEYAISGLLSAGLIQAVARKETIGRPLLYGTTDEFLKKFGLHDIDDLPDYDEVLENLRLLNTTQESLFRTRRLYDEEGNLLEEQMIGEAASDVIEHAPEDVSEIVDEEEELPEFLIGEETVEVYD